MSGEWSFGSQVPAGEQRPTPPPALAAPAFVQGVRGPYRLLQELGSGGAGKVFRALDPTGVEVALKILLRADDAQHLERFAREGRMAASIQHPNVITVHEIGQHEGHAFLVYELIDEETTFAEALQTYDLDDRLDLLAQVIDGVAAAHRLGLIHRDIKAENILLGRDGRPRVTDFGLGRGEQDQRLTQSGALLGTPRVMAPEQVRSEREQQGPATDVWSLGVLLYQALTGQTPFNATTLAELVVQVTTADPTPPRQLNRAAPPEVERVCLRALSKHPDDRYSDAGELGRALIAARRRKRTARRGALPAILATGGLVLLALSIGVGAAVAVRLPAGTAPTANATEASPAEPNLLERSLAQVDRLYSAKRYHRSLDLIREVVKRFPDSVEANLNEGEILCQLGRWADALVAFDRARKLDPDNIRALTSSGGAKAKLRRYDEGLVDLNRALEIDPKHADALEKRSLLNYERNEYRKALDDANRALEIDPDSAEGINFRGLARGALGDLKGALKDFQRAYALGKDPNILTNIGTIMLDMGDTEEGERIIRKSLEINPEQNAAWTSLGVEHIKAKRNAAGLRAFERALRIAPDDPWARFGRAVALRRLSRFDEAKAEAEWIVREHPQHPHAAEARKMLRSLARRTRQRERERK